ncbi:MAG: hypothetical protein AAF203_06385 [Pseudomonadota bacterium]
MSHVHIGKIHSPQGVRGDVFVLVFAGEAAWIDQWDVLSFSQNRAVKPSNELKIQKKRIHQKQKKWGVVIHLEGVDDRSAAEELVGENVFIPESFLVSEPGEEIYLREVLGFDVIDESRGCVGQVFGFSGTNLQDLIIIAAPDAGVLSLYGEMNDRPHLTRATALLARLSR